MSNRQAVKQLQRVAHVRGIRLARAAEDARMAHENAEAELEYASDAKHNQDAKLNHAKTFFATNPACEQSRIWLSHNVSKSGECAEAVDDARYSVDQTAAQRAEAVRAVAKHDVRSEQLKAHHASLRRAEVRLAENRAELDANAGVAKERPW